MIYVILIIFFTSLVSIIFMIARKLVVLGNGNCSIPDNASFEVPYVEETKNFLGESIKKLEHVALVFIIRFLIQTKNFFQNMIEDMKNVLRNLHFKKYPNGELIEKIENSKLLKMTNRYRRKIKDITRQVKKEEKNM